MTGERSYTTKIWRLPSSIGFSSADALSTSMDPPGEPVISTRKRSCQKIQNGSEFPELVAQNFRNPQLSVPKILTLFIPEILSRPAIAGRAKTLSVPPVGEPVGPREEDVRNAKASRNRNSTEGRSLQGRSGPSTAHQLRCGSRIHRIVRANIRDPT